jgi:hypothetical protein
LDSFAVASEPASGMTQQIAISKSHKAMIRFREVNLHQGL